MALEDTYGHIQKHFALSEPHFEISANALPETVHASHRHNAFHQIEYDMTAQAKLMPGIFRFI